MSSNRTDRLFLSLSPETNEREGEFGLHGQLHKRKKQREMASLDYRKEGNGEKIGKNTLKKSRKDRKISKLSAPFTFFSEGFVPHLNQNLGS